METLDRFRELFRMQRALNARIGVKTDAMSEEEKINWTTERGCLRSYSPDGRIEYSLLQRFWLVARREEGSIAAALFDPTSNNATSQKRCNPWGKGRFVLRLRCLLGRGSLRIHSLARASPQAKPPLCKLYSILPSGEYEGQKLIARFCIFLLWQLWRMWDDRVVPF